MTVKMVVGKDPSQPSSFCGGVDDKLDSISNRYLYLKMRVPRAIREDLDGEGPEVSGLAMGLAENFAIARVENAS
jgi:hypothetical protein